MENFINTFELDFSRDIPEEIIVFQEQCKKLTTSNQKLKTALYVIVFCIVVYLIYQMQFKKKKDKENIEFN